MDAVVRIWQADLGYGQGEAPDPSEALRGCSKKRLENAISRPARWGGRGVAPFERLSRSDARKGCLSRSLSGTGKSLS